MRASSQTYAVAGCLALACADTREDGDGTAFASAAETGVDSSTADGDPDDPASSGDGDAADASDGGTKLDVGAPASGGDEGGTCGGTAGEELSYIWIVNTADSPPTVAKIDTRTLQEVGRYLTRADGLGDPSRTSVALSGHAVVGNRSGGVTKYYAYDCPAGPTSAGGADSELPWGMDACIAWSTDFEYETQRPVAWTPGTFDEATCSWSGEHVWSSGANGGNTLEVLRIDGDTGALLDLVPIPEIDAGFYGAYGGAVDGDGNFWFSQLGIDGRSLVRVDAISLAVDIHAHEIDGYGIQVDNQGRPWICGYDGMLGRFTPGSNTWSYADMGEPMFGCMPDESHLWVGGLEGTLRGIDLESMQVAEMFALPLIDNPEIHGTSIDHDGKIWGVSVGTMAARVDPETGEVDYVEGLQGPYTYSDMTGYALSHAGSPAG